MYYVYRFLDKSQNVIYVGKSKLELERRFNHHQHLPKECYAMVDKIQFIVCKTESDMSIKEIYYINKYKSTEHYFFNVLDTTEIPKSVEFDDKWKMYRGPLPAHFSHSINFKKGYTTQKEVRYNKDGSVDKRKTNKEKGVPSYVDGFDEKEIDLIYINFSDPWPKSRHEKRRLTHRSFLEIYKTILKDNGEIHFKTDNRGLFDFSIEEFKEDVVAPTDAVDVVEEKETLVIGYTIYEPMNYLDEAGELTGFDTEFAEAVCEILSIPSADLFFNISIW